MPKSERGARQISPVNVTIPDSLFETSAIARRHEQLDPCEIQDYELVILDLSRFDAAPLIAFTAAKETGYGTETEGRIAP